MSGRFTSWDPEGAFASIYNKIIAPVEETAEEIAQLAIARAPVRKAFKARKAKSSELADFKQKIGKSTYTGAELLEAAQHLGIPLDEHGIRSVRGGVAKVFPARAQSGRNYGANNPNYRRSSTSRITGTRLRQVNFIETPGGLVKRKTIGGVRTGEFQIDKQRLRRQRVQLLARARSEIKRGAGVIRSHGRYQYGGYLRAHIKVVEVQTDPSSKVIHFRVVSSAAYSRYVEFPTSRTAAQPFLLPAFKSQRERYAARLRRAIKG